MKLHFLGGTDTVTGSQLIVEANGHRVLRDCGLYQGPRQWAFDLNRKMLFDAKTIRAVALSHAHIDHCGNLPSLVRNGFHGPIYTNSATSALCAIMLNDSARLQEQDAAYLNQKTNRKGLPPIEPLYTSADVEQTLKLFHNASYYIPVTMAPGITAVTVEAGHIMGAALTTFTVEEANKTTKVGFALDLGRPSLPIIRDPEILQDIDILIMESTYGDRLHENAEKAREQLRDIILRVFQRGGRVMIPSFVLERAQEILYHLVTLVESEELPPIPVYVDSPMAIAVTRVFEDKIKYQNQEYMDLTARMGSVMRQPWIHFVSSVAESKDLMVSKEPCVIIAGSGMCEHGRILHHLKHGIENPDNAIVIVGFQAQNTLGRRIVERQEEVRIFGDSFHLHAEVNILNAFSGHADREGLLAYARAVKPKSIYLVHGESKSRESLAEALRAEAYAEINVPKQGFIAEINEN